MTRSRTKVARFALFAALSLVLAIVATAAKPNTACAQDSGGWCWTDGNSSCVCDPIAAPGCGNGWRWIVEADEKR